MVIILCACVLANFWENYEHWWFERATGRLKIIQGSKITRGFCKPFGYKVITIFITHSYCFQT